LNIFLLCFFSSTREFLSTLHFSSCVYRTFKTLYISAILTHLKRNKIGLAVLAIRIEIKILSCKLSNIALRIIPPPQHLTLILPWRFALNQLAFSWKFQSHETSTSPSSAHKIAHAYQLSGTSYFIIRGWTV